MADLMTALRNADAAGDEEAARRIAGMIKNQATQESSFIDDAVGVGENILSTASGIVAEPVAGIVGLAQSINPFAEKGAGAEAVADVREAMTYQPRTESGQEKQAAIGEAVAPIGEALTAAESYLGDSVLDLTGSPALATAAHTLPTAALELLGIKGSKGFTSPRKIPTDSQVSKAIVESAPEIDAIKKASSAVYKEIDDSGAVVKPNKINQLVSSIESKTRKKGLDPRVTKEAAGALDALKEIKGKSQPITELEVQRNIAQKVAGSKEPGQAMLGNIMIDEIDNFMDSLSAKDMIKGNAETAKKYKSARKLWGRARRSELIQEAIEQGENAASGAENGIRVKLRSIANNKNKSKFFSKQELDAINDVVKGDFKTNMAKLVGRFGFSEGGATNILSSLAGSFGGASVFGPVGAVAVPAAGQASRVIAKKLTKNKAKFADAMTRAGSDANRIAKAYLTAVPKAKRSVEDLSDLLVDPKINLDELEMIANETFQDAVDIAKGKRAINLASGAATASLAKSNQEEGENNGNN